WEPQLDGRTGANYAISQFQAAHAHPNLQAQVYLHYPSHYASGKSAASALPQCLSKYSKALKSMALKTASLQVWYSPSHVLCQLLTSSIVHGKPGRPGQPKCKQTCKEIEDHSTGDTQGPVELVCATVLNNKVGAPPVGPSIQINEATKKLATP
ncbi:hypothetical protein FRC11_002132, partial [Ceratobasidium sp. 423]